MGRRIEHFFSGADREAIHAATTAAEQRTAGELVVFVTERCDPHPETHWAGALLGGAIGALVASLAVWRFGGWGAPDTQWFLIGLQAGVVVGWIASRFDAVARRLIRKDALESRVESRAAEAFLSEQVFATRERTGVLVFVALFEHRVLVLADEGIDAHVDASSWDSICKDLADGIRAGEPAGALIEAVERCADLLVEHRVGEPDGDNELSNEPRFRDE